MADKLFCHFCYGWVIFAVVRHTYIRSRLLEVILWYITAFSNLLHSMNCSHVLVLLNRISMIDISCPWILPCSRVESASRIRSRSCSWSSSRASSWPCSWIRSISLPRSLLRFSVQCWHWLKLVLLLLSLRLELLFLVSIWNLVV